MRRALVVTADDVGLHPGMTAGALAAHDAGIVTACSLSPVGQGFAAAVAALAARPALEVGVHLTLVGERPLSPPAEVASLLGRDGRFLPAFPAFVRRHLARRLVTSELERELRRQIERVLAAGLVPRHLNSHQHLHVLPRVFALVARLAVEYDIPFVRLPNDPAVRRAWTPRAAALRVLAAFGRRARRALDAEPRLAAAERTLGLLVAGRLTAPRLRALLPDVAGLCELVCHPGLGGAELARAYDWRYGWDEETAALSAPGLAATLAAEGIALTTFTAARAAS